MEIDQPTVAEHGFCFILPLPPPSFFLQAHGLGSSAVVLASRAEMAYSYQQNAPLAYRLAKQVYTADPFDERCVGSVFSGWCVTDRWDLALLISLKAIERVTGKNQNHLHRLLTPPTTTITTTTDRSCLPIYICAMAELGLKTELYYCAHQLVEVNKNKISSRDQTRHDDDDTHPLLHTNSLHHSPPRFVVILMTTTGAPQERRVVVRRRLLLRRRAQERGRPAVRSLL